MYTRISRKRTQRQNVFQVALTVKHYGQKTYTAYLPSGTIAPNKIFLFNIYYLRSAHINFKCFHLPISLFYSFLFAISATFASSTVLHRMRYCEFQMRSALAHLWHSGKYAHRTLHYHQTILFSLSLNRYPCLRLSGKRIWHINDSFSIRSCSSSTRHRVIYLWTNSCVSNISTHMWLHLYYIVYAIFWTIYSGSMALGGGGESVLRQIWTFHRSVRWELNQLIWYMCG